MFIFFISYRLYSKGIYSGNHVFFPFKPYAVVFYYCMKYYSETIILLWSVEWKESYKIMLCFCRYAWILSLFLLWVFPMKIILLLLLHIFYRLLSSILCCFLVNVKVLLNSNATTFINFYVFKTCTNNFHLGKYMFSRHLAIGDIVSWKTTFLYKIKKIMEKRILHFFY